MMNLKQLHYFVTIAELGSFTRASELLHIAQPALSMSVRKLEQQLELTLFHRHDKRISLTDEGKRLLLHGRKILQASNDALTEMRELKGLEKGEVRVGIPGMLGSYYFPPLLMAFRERYPNLRLEVIEGGVWELQQLLEKGDIDLAVVAEAFLRPQLQAEVFLREQMMVTLAADHPLAQQSSISYQQFFQQQLVLFKPGYFHRKLVDQLANDGGYQPQIGFETNLIALIKAIVQRGYGISTLLEMVIQPQDGLVARPFSQPVRLNLALAWRRDGYLSKANRAFADFVLENTGDLQY